MPAQFITFRPAGLLFVDKHDTQSYPTIPESHLLRTIYKITLSLGTDQRYDQWKKTCNSVLAMMCAEDIYLRKTELNTWKTKRRLSNYPKGAKNCIDYCLEIEITTVRCSDLLPK